jgi:3-oxoacyl-[acyl-carrier protein] reductase
MHDLAGQRALVTGASAGIGLAIARSLAESGCHVAVNGRDEARLKRVAETIPGALACAGDMSDAAQASEAIEAGTQALGGLDILVCAAGSGRSTPPGAETPTAWSESLASNLLTAVYATACARPHLAASKGSVTCISSICSLEVVPGAPVTYSSSKAALNAFVRGMARPLSAEGIRINAVAPGNIDHDTSVWRRRMEIDREAVNELVRAEVPLGRLGVPEDVAGTVLFLASSAATFITGSIVVVDGGQTRG